ncbi:sulfotransferase [Hyphomonas sp. GM-8P]|uniref:sulfotransferase n=1 Tax=Hyphomonas sp. GM-8P TaxID=1280945 RepID=UPI001F42B8C4|nr:sulfotransferase [Hyphomonas sp. GM-8P]
MTQTIRIAMWSGPRNMSTTMMRSFGARPEAVCVDEPFYAAWLTASGEVHPMQEETLASQSSDPAVVAGEMLAPLPPGKTLHYQKQMTHHMLESFPLDWVSDVRHAFLVRHPGRVIASYTKKMSDVSLEAIGVPQQERLYREITERTGKAPPVVDSDRLLADPPEVLPRLCDALGIDWDPAMLGWAPGAKPEDGAWAPHWYDAVWKSSGFGPPPGERPALRGRSADIEKEALESYERLLRNHV